MEGRRFEPSPGGGDYRGLSFVRDQPWEPTERRPQLATEGLSPTFPVAIGNVHADSRGLLSDRRAEDVPS